eukprot:jgi/Ulvmu1/9813/UM056_0054.1
MYRTNGIIFGACLGAWQCEAEPNSNYIACQPGKTPEALKFDFDGQIVTPSHLVSCSNFSRPHGGRHDSLDNFCHAAHVLHIAVRAQCSNAQCDGGSWTATCSTTQLAVCFKLLSCAVTEPLIEASMLDCLEDGLAAEKPTQCSSHGSAPPSPKELPPRIVVQNPNGDVSLGEDIHRLRHETIDASRKQQAHVAASLQPGGHRWLHIAFQTYAATLHSVLSSRKRLMLTPVGVDMGAMLWPVICIIAQRFDLDMGAKETLPAWAVLSLSSTCIMLDAATLLACAQDSPTVLLIITLAHAPLYASMYASHLSYNLWVLTKIFVVICTVRVLAIITELDWLRSARQEQLLPPSGCLPNVNALLLSQKLREHRQAFIQALENHRNPADVEPSDSSVSFQIGTIQVDR